MDGDAVVARVYGSDDFRESVGAFLERRKPRFRGAVDRSRAVAGPNPTYMLFSRYY